MNVPLGQLLQEPEHNIEMRPDIVEMLAIISSLELTVLRGLLAFAAQVNAEAALVVSTLESFFAAAFGVRPRGAFFQHDLNSCTWKQRFEEVNFRSRRWSLESVVLPMHCVHGLHSGFAGPSVYLLGLHGMHRSFGFGPHFLTKRLPSELQMQDVNGCCWETARLKPAAAQSVYRSTNRHSTSSLFVVVSTEKRLKLHLVFQLPLWLKGLVPCLGCQFTHTNADTHALTALALR